MHSTQEPAELEALCRDSKTAWRALGRVDYGRKSSEQGNARFRRSLYVTRDMKAGELFSADNVRSVRPGFGLPPKMLDQIIGRRASRDIAFGTALSMDLVE